MGNQNFDAFKPLNEEEEKQIKGGGANAGNPQCQQILSEMNQLQQQINGLLQQGQAPAAVHLQQKLAVLETEYNQCQNQTK